MLKLFFSIFLFLLSLLHIVAAPTYLFWKVSVFITEAGIFLLLLCLILLLIPGWSSMTGILSALFLIAAIVLFSLPLVAGQKINRELPGELTEHFGPVSGGSPFRIWRCFYAKDPDVKFRSLVYKETDNQSLQLDFYKAESSMPAPCVIVIHGGSWASGDSRQISGLNSYLAKNGYAVASINYRLSPEFHSPAPNEDLSDALTFLKSRAVELNIDTDNFVLLGRSAGGQIALLSAYTLKDPSIRGVIAFYPPADMVWGYHNPGNPLVLDSRKVLNEYAGGSPPEVPLRLKECSPIEFTGPHCPPTLLIHGCRDIMVAYKHSTKLQVKLRQHGVKNFLLTLPWATHGFDFFPHGLGGQISRFTILNFLEKLKGDMQIRR